MHELGTETIALSTAAAIAYRQVFSTRPDPGTPPSVEELDLVALALSVHLPIYGMRGPSAAPSKISEEELLQGMFWGGATRFELWQQMTPITQLKVRSSDFERVLERLKQRRNEL
jgi:hypothetical protein